MSRKKVTKEILDSESISNLTQICQTKLIYNVNVSINVSLNRCCKAEKEGSNCH